MSDWEDSDKEIAAPAPKIVPKKPANKWQGEDEEEDGPVSDWEKSSESEDEKPVSAPVAPPKKKGTLKAKLAEKEAAKAARRAAGEESEEESFDSDDVLDPRAKALRDKQRELEADMKNAAELFGANSVKNGTDTPSDLGSLLSVNPKTKDDFFALSRQIFELVIKPHQDKPLYAAFVEQHVKELASPLRDVDVRKAASGLTTLANEKQKEAKDKASGKKKKATSKPALGGAKTVNKLDTGAYEESLDDFGNDPSDFM